MKAEGDDKWQLLGQRLHVGSPEEAWSHHTASSHTSTRKTVFDNTMDIVHADDIGVSWVIPLIKPSSWIKGA